jgi:uncharacterized protein YdeI (YjbR/CyaY-like superfamily)
MSRPRKAEPAAASYPQVEVKSRAAWRSWLLAHHGREGGVWLVTYKKGRGPHLPYGEAVEEALCFGWVDSLPRKLDEDRTMLLMTPRKAGSAWSAANKARVATLLAAGLIAPAGLAKVEEAKASGAWDKLDAVEALTIPDDLAAALAAASGAAAAFADFPRSARRGILEWIVQAKRPDTRAKRIAETARLAGQGKRANQWRGD